eukprot:7391719-Prymnesium_polylepis.1
MAAVAWGPMRVGARAGARPLMGVRSGAGLRWAAPMGFGARAALGGTDGCGPVLAAAAASGRVLAAAAGRSRSRTAVRRPCPIAGRGSEPKHPRMRERGTGCGTGADGGVDPGRSACRSVTAEPPPHVWDQTWWRGGGIRDLEHLRSVHVAGVWVGSTHHRSTIRVPDMFVMSVVAKSSSLEKEFHSTFDRFCNGTLPRVN